MQISKKDVLFCLIIFIICFFILEIATRATTQEPMRSIVRYDDVLIWKYAPNIDFKGLETNSEGFRDSEFLPSEDKKVFVLLGDSYAAGLSYDIEDILSERIEHYSEESFEVVNLGVSAYATDQQYLLLNKTVWDYNPSSIILVVTPNDIRESYNKRIFFMDEGMLFFDGSNKALHLSFADRFLWWLSSVSEVFYILQFRLGLNYGSFEFIFNKATNGVFFNETRGLTQDQVIFLTDETDEVKEALVLFEELIYQMDKKAKENGTQLIVVNLPIKMQFDGSIDDKGLFEKNKVGDILNRLSVNHNIFYLDLYPAFEESEKPLNYYIDSEYHLNKEGHDFVGKRIYEFITERS